MAKKNADAILSEARQELININARLSDGAARRDKLLLFFGDEKALDAIEVELANLRKAHERQADRIKLLEQEAAREEAEAVAKKRADLVARFEKKLQMADAAADELQVTLAKAEQLFRTIIKHREDARAAWPLGDSHTNAIVGTAEGCALSGAAVKRLLSFHLYKIGARPFLGGRPGEIVEETFPGAVCPRNEWRGIPEKITSFADALRAASKYAVDMMRGKLDPLAALPTADTEQPEPIAPSGNGRTPGPVRTPDQERLAQLLREQARLSEDITPAGEAAYQEVVKQITALQ
jgi:hypothetical protein